MHKLDIKSTLKSPRVLFDPKNNIFEIEGNARPENVRDFFYPIIDSLRSYFEENQKTDANTADGDNTLKFNFKLEYFNSASAKFVADILVLVAKFNGKGFDIKVYWYFDEGDDDMKEVGEDFSDMVDFPFNYIMIQR